MASTAPTEGHTHAIRVIVSRVQVAEHYVRAVDEEDAAKKIQAELDRPYSFLGAWKTSDTEMDIVEADSALTKVPAPVGDGTLLMSIKDAAAHLGISAGSLYTLMSAGEIEHVAVGRRRYISRDGLKKFIETNTHRGTGRGYGYY